MSDSPPDGWMTTHEIATKMGLSAFRVRKVIDKIRDELPEMVSVFSAPSGTARCEYFHPQIVTKVTTQLGGLMHRFFNRPPDEVAIDLEGMTLQVGNRKGTITRIKPQYPKDNENWGDRPLFSSRSVGVYVARYRGHCMLFLRTGPTGINTCVRIDGLKTRSKVCRTPSQVCEALGIKSERTGNLQLSGNVVSLSWS